MALTHAGKDAMCMEDVLGYISLASAIPTTLLGDDHGALALALNPDFHAHIEHICVCHHFIRDCIVNQDIKLKYIAMGEQVANVLTKGLPLAKHVKFTVGMGLVGVSAH